MGELITIVSSASSESKPLTALLRSGVKRAIIAVFESLEGVIFDRRSAKIPKRDLSKLEELQLINRGGRPVLRGTTVLTHPAPTKIELN